MAHCYYHALSSVRKWGGVVEDYLDLHQWFDQSKSILADPRHRALRHHAEGIFMLENLFGATLINADGKTVPTRLVGEQHVIEDLGLIPSFADWARLTAYAPRIIDGHSSISMFSKSFSAAYCLARAYVAAVIFAASLSGLSWFSAMCSRRIWSKDANIALA